MEREIDNLNEYGLSTQHNLIKKKIMFDAPF